ncbi:SDR family NAD(P)-dependent oxidoreductase [Streptomyces sp. NPDC056983]|uniref:SDR family NAD(P)-dependent oxidoreductase n=1 Tax=Streptomyces sp. NPDC056983 TaxID=3345987 RepID=UPI003632265E
MTRYENKTCVVTGGAQGIGRACAEKLAAEGGRVAIFDLESQVKALDVEAFPGEVIAIACDVSSRADVEDAFAECARRLGPVDVLVSNAGTVLARDFLKMEDDEFAKLMDVNVHGTFMTGQVAARQMVESGRGGAIVNMASVGAFMNNALHVGYGATKGAIVSLTKGMAVALAPQGVRVNAVAPATIETSMTENYDQDPTLLNGVKARTPMGRLGTAGEVASAVAYLAGDDAAYVTGHTLLVDGGRTSLNYFMHDVPETPAEPK